VVCRYTSLIIALSIGALAADPDLPFRDWPAVGNAGGLRYSPLRQINRENVQKLRKVWQFDSHDEYDGSEMQCNPLVVDGVLYATTPRLRVIALDAATGKLLWDFDLHRGEKVSGKQRNRGLSYWTDGKRDQRLYVGLDDYLYALDLRSGKPVDSFGTSGRIDLHDGLGDRAKGMTVRATSPGVVFKDLLIQGTLVAEDLPAAPGHIRAFDVRTGKLRWMFKTIPGPGELGYDTWPKDAYTRIGGANSWAGLTVDAERGIVFVPTGSAAFDFYGANRHGDNLFANCLLALNAATGERLWHFQFVHHDVWDRDLPTAPTLVRVQKDGKAIDAVAQITKSGFIWLFDRQSGKPLNRYEEVKVEASDVDGEELSAKQPLPLEPKPFSRQQLTADMLTNRTPEAHAWAVAALAKLRSGPQFTPPSKQGTIVFPGFDGGGEWGGGTYDPETGMFYINANEMAWVLRLVPRTAATGTQTGRTLYARNCSGCHKPDMSGSPPEFPSLKDLGQRVSRERVVTVVNKGAGRMPGFAHLGGASVDAIVQLLMTGENKTVGGAEHEHKAGPTPLKYGIDGYNRFLDPDGYPAIAPPWGTLNAINLNTGEYAWKQPFGELPALVEKGIRNTGSENYGGSVVTAGGLLFIGATNYDRKFRAFDKSNGKLLWETMLPAAGNATPAVYQVKGKQFVVIGAGGGKSGAPSGGSYVAFALE
jgi:quinoprotein glucose dehydrogenase